jgi:Protein of unknown function (DUF3644)
MCRSLLRNSRAALLAAIEIHNKPIFQYRYEVCTLLVINAWELLLKAFIRRNLPKVKIVLKDGTTKPFLDCLACVASSLGKGFEVARYNLEVLYEYRNQVAHFFPADIEPLLFALLRKNVSLYIGFLECHFGIELSNESLVLLPIGLGSAPASPLDFIAAKAQDSRASLEAKRLIGSITRSATELEAKGIQECIFVPVAISLINETRVKNSDIVAAINNTEVQEHSFVVRNVLAGGRLVESADARPVRIEEESLFSEFYTETYHDVVTNASAFFVDFRQNAKFNKIMADVKENSSLHKRRFLDVQSKHGSYKDYYSKAVYKELEKHYRRGPSPNGQAAAAAAAITPSDLRGD